MAFDKNDPKDMEIVQGMIDEAVSGLKSKNEELVGKVKKLSKDKEGGISQEEFDRLEAERDALKENLTTAQRELKAEKKANETNASALASERSFNERVLIENGLAAALSANGVTNAAHAKAAAALIRSTSKIEITVDGDNRAASIGGKALGDFVKEWAGTDDGKNFVTAKGNGGGGAPGGQQQPTPAAGNMGGTRAERVAALQAKFGDRLADAAQ